MKPLFLALATLTAITACKSDETVRAYGAGDKVWVLREMNGATAAARTTLTLAAPGQISGSAPCNDYSAPMTVPYPWFNAGPIAATKSNCPALQHETEYFDTLRAVTLSEVLGDTMILSNTGGAELVFKTAD